MANDTFNVTDFDRLHRSRLLGLVDDLRTLGLLTEKDFDKAQAFLDRADIAQSTASDHSRYLVARTQEIGRELAGADIDADKVRAEAGSLADETHVLRICEAIWTAAVREATGVVYANAGRYTDVLNAELEALVEKAGELEGELTGIASADAALQAGKGEEWVAAGELVSTYQWLRSVIERLREAGKLPRSDARSTGAWWNYRKPVKFVGGGFRRGANQAPADGGRADFFRAMLAGPFVPTEEEAKAARRDHEEAEAEYQAKLYGIAR